MQKLTEVVGDQRETWHLKKELLHSDDKPPAHHSTGCIQAGDVIAAYSLSYHQYADDTQLYMAVRPCADVTFKAVSEYYPGRRAMVPRKWAASQPSQD